MMQGVQAIDPNLLDVVKEDDRYILAFNGTPMRTPAGNDVADPSQRLMEHMLREIALSGGLVQDTLNAYTQFAFTCDCFGDSGDKLLEKFEEIVQADPILRRRMCCTMDSSMENVDALMDVLEQHAGAMMFMMGGVTAIMKSMNRFFQERTEGGGQELRSMEGGASFCRNLYDALTEVEQAGVNLLRLVHRSGILLPLLLTYGRITPSEYANTLFSLHLPGVQPEDCPVTWEDVCVHECLPDWQQPEQSFETLRRQAAGVQEYLACFESMDRRLASMRDLIDLGESYNLEFKSTFRINLHTGKPDPRINHASCKSIAAFLNSGGGSLLVGVRDDGSIEGIESDQFENHDRFSLHFWSVVETLLGLDNSPYIKTSFEEIDGRSVFRVKCSKSPRPVFLRPKGKPEEFYIRIGPKSVQLSIEKALTYIGHRFEGR
jgi:hypothetical protein